VQIDFRFGVTSTHPGWLAATVQVPPLPDMIAAAQRIGKVCHVRTHAAQQRGAVYRRPGQRWVM